MTIAAAMVLTRMRQTTRAWSLMAACVVVTAAPLVLWIDYLRSIYRSLAFAGGSHITVPFAGLAPKLRMTVEGWASVPAYPTVASTLALIGLCAQCWIVARAQIRHRRDDSPAALVARTWAAAASSFIVLAGVTQ